MSDDEHENLSPLSPVPPIDEEDPPVVMAALKGMCQQGREESRITVADVDGTLLYEETLPTALLGRGPDEGGWEPPAHIKAIWDRIQWSNVNTETGQVIDLSDQDIAEIRKVMTCFIIEIGMDGQIIPRPDFSDRYDMLRPATNTDMLNGCAAVLELLRADLVAELLQRRSEDALLAGIQARNGGGTRS